VNNKVIMITGAGGALGAALAARYAGEPASLALVTRGRNGRVPAEAPDVLHVAADLSDPAAADEAVARVLARFGRIDALFNLAGGFAPGSAENASLRDAEQLLDLNYLTAFNTTLAVLPGMLQRGDGFILGVAAAAAIRGSSRASAYAASKGALLSWFRSLALELRPRGIRTSVLVPMGTIDTPANREAMPNADPARFIPLEELVDALLFLAARSQRAAVTELRIG
jgi:NAD(P)-dependent dehydrogenase (short-subunit alcohol dehydrogenase family)